MGGLTGGFELFRNRTHWSLVCVVPSAHKVTLPRPPTLARCFCLKD